jgi:hypothetical protein
MALAWFVIASLIDVASLDIVVYNWMPLACSMTIVVDVVNLAILACNSMVLAWCL